MEQALTISEPATDDTVGVLVIGTTALDAFALSECLSMHPLIKGGWCWTDGLKFEDPVRKLRDPSGVDVAVIDADRSCRARLVRLVAATLPQARRIVLAADDDPHVLVECARVGASGYLPRRARPDDLVAAVLEAARGASFCPTELMPTLLLGLQSARHAAERDQGLPAFTRREIEVASLLQRGLTTKAIAAHLCIETQTAKNYTQRIFRKLGVHSRAEMFGALSHVELPSLIAPSAW